MELDTDITGIWQKLIVIIIGIVVIISFFTIMDRIKNSALDNTQSASCRADNELDAAGHFDIITLTTRPKTNNCNTRAVLIKGNPEKNPDEIREKIAKEMADCWYKYLEGKPLFEDKSGVNVYCGFCSIIEFQEKGKTIKGINDYLTKNKVKDGSGRLYWDYLYPALSTEKIDDLEFLNKFVVLNTVYDSAERIRKFREFLMKRDIEINTDEKVAIMFLQGKTVTNFLGVQRAIRGFINLVGLADLETIIPTSLVVYIPYNSDEVSELNCIYPIDQFREVDFDNPIVI